MRRPVLEQDFVIQARQAAVAHADPDRTVRVLPGGRNQSAGQTVRLVPGADLSPVVTHQAVIGGKPESPGCIFHDVPGQSSGKPVVAGQHFDFPVSQAIDAAFRRDPDAAV